MKLLKKVMVVAIALCMIFSLSETQVFGKETVNHVVKMQERYTMG